MLGHPSPPGRRGATALSQFLGLHPTRLDAKGRTSVPAPFRALLRTGESGAMPIVLRPSHNFACIEGYPAAVFEEFAKPLNTFDMFSEDSDDMEAALYAEAWPVEPDKDGRILLPDSMVQHAGLTDAIVFMGLRNRFQIWEAQAGMRRAAEARERVRARRLTLPGNAP